MKKSVFITALVAGILSLSSVCSAEEYDAVIQIENMETVHGSESSVSVSVNLNENKGICGVIAKLESDAEIIKTDNSQSDILNDADGVQITDYTLGTDIFMWTSKSTENIMNTGRIADVLINSENLYPGVYNISFMQGNKTMGTKKNSSSYDNADINWINGTLTVNGNDDDIKNAFAIGDLDGNGEVDSYDALLMLQNVVGINELDNTQKIIADDDFNGDITSDDALNALLYASGLSTGFSDGENSALYTGIYLNDDGTVKARSYYSDNQGHAVKINYTD